MSKTTDYIIEKMNEQGTPEVEDLKKPSNFTLLP